ncbi:MAG: flagellar hook-length control protein FliK [Sarcina sp.]
MRVNMVEFEKLDVMKLRKEEKVINKKDRFKDKSFENVLNDSKNIKEQKELRKKSDEKIDIKKAKSASTETESKDVKNNTQNTNTEIEDIKVENLLAMLLAVNNTLESDSELSIEERIILEADKNFVNEAKEILNKVASKENLNGLSLEFLDSNNSLNEKIKIPVVEELEELIKEIKIVNLEIKIDRNNFDLNQMKELIVKALNEKGLSNEDIKSLNMNVEIVKDAHTAKAIDNGITINKDEVKNVNNLSQGDLDEKSNVILDQKGEVETSKLNQEKTFDMSSKEDFNEKSGESKEDDFLSKLLTEDKSVFDINLQRMKDFSNIQKIDSKISINKETINMDIKNTVLNMTKVNMKEMIVKVNPGNLGEISIKLIAEADSMKAVIKVSSKETYALISGQDIKQHLSSENIKISDVEIELYKEDTTFFNESNEFMGKDESRKNYSETSKNESMELEDEIEEEITLASLDIII